MNKLIWKTEEVQNFIDFLPELQNDEVYFLSLSARDKYLTDSERLYYHLGRTEMFSREIARDKEGIYLALNRMEASLKYRLTKNGLEMPEKALVVYINANPSSMIQAFFMFNKDMNGVMSEMIKVKEGGDKETHNESFKRLPTKLMNCIQKARSRKVIVDIDVDVEGGKENVDNVLSLLKKFVGNNAFTQTWRYIITQGGFHIIWKTKNIPLKYNPMNFISFLRDLDEVKEAEFNSNGMVPMAGTFQAEHKVRMI